MLMNRKGQMGPQAMEDVPITIMAFIAAVAAVILFINITSGYLSESKLRDMHDTGKRLVENVPKVFESDFVGVLDAELLDGVSTDDPSLEGVFGPIEYGFWVQVKTKSRMWVFGQGPPRNSLAYGAAASVLSGTSLSNAEIIVKIWRK
jgi:hypothetical protein